jgi:lipoprotein-releasing system ATP-binding protein
MIDVIDVKRSFQREEGEVSVLRGVNLRVEKGESVSIMGRSGAGKSTLLQIMGTLDRPDSGTVLVDELDVFTLSDSKLAKFRGREIGFVFQFHHLLPEFSSVENAAMPARISGAGKREAEEKAAYYLDRVGLADRLTHRPSELSGGEQQRVALARALVMEPRLLLADEPTGNLDDKIGEQIFELLRELNEELQISIVVVTHNPRLASVMKRRLVMEGGKLVQNEGQMAVEPLDGEAAW